MKLPQFDNLSYTRLRKAFPSAFRTLRRLNNPHKLRAFVRLVNAYLTTSLKKGVVYLKKHQLQSIYVLLGVSLLSSLLIAIVLLCANANSNYLYTQQRAENLKTRQSLIQALQAVKAQKVDTDTANAQKASTEAELKAKIDDLNNQLQAKLDREAAAQVAYTAPVTGGLGGGFSAPSAASVAGNGYTYGQCTYGVKTWRPDIPNNWGNADTWYYNAQAIGWPTGTVPRVGAIAAAVGYMHVAYVIGIGNGTVTVQEENYVGWNIVSTRIAPISEFVYIY